MRILVLHSRYLSGPASGENRVVDDEVRLLEEAGHDVVLWAPSVDADGIANKMRAGLGVVWSQTAVRHVERLAREHRPDVVHIHNLFPTLSPAVLRAIDGAALVVTLHNYRFGCLPGTLYRDGHVCTDCVGRLPWPGVVHRCFKDSRAASSVMAASLSLHRGIDSFGRVDLFLAVSEFLKERHVEMGIDADRILVKRNFTWPSLSREGPGEFFLYAGRLAPEKGLDTILEAWTRVDAPLLIVGEGPEDERLRVAAPTGVEFRTTVPGAEIAALTRRARAMLVPSRWYETASRTVIEAYAAGVPVLASRVGGIPEVVSDAETGFLLDPDTPTAWASAATSLLDDHLSIELGSQAQARWRAEFTPDQALSAIMTTYEKAVAGSGATGAA
jgi:glycosyltransferase involved in cell wall biosynthesis